MGYPQSPRGLTAEPDGAGRVVRLSADEAESGIPAEKLRIVIHAAVKP